MTDEEIRAYMEEAIKRTVEECKRAGLLTEKGAAYSDAAEMLTRYYEDGKKDNAITYALQGIRFDPYSRIIEMYFGECRTNAEIAEALGVDIRTVARNKRRLCLKIYEDLT